MRLDVTFSPGEIVPGDLAGRTAVVIDVLRASTSIVEALAAGAKAIYPVPSVEDALRLAHSLGRQSVLLAGERRRLPIEGFDLGNSPAEFSGERVAGKTLIMSTTNGTVVFGQTATADRVIVASLGNLSAVVDDLVRSQAEPVLLCSGRERQFALEDAVCAGLLAARLGEATPGPWELNDAAIAAVALAGRFGSPQELFPMTEAGRAIAEVGLGDDLSFCAQLDRHHVVPVFQDRHITAAPATL
jgi:2-phosphosulfolactate phosphatase